MWADGHCGLTLVMCLSWLAAAAACRTSPDYEMFLFPVEEREDQEGQKGQRVGRGGVAPVSQAQPGA